MSTKLDLILLKGDTFRKTFQLKQSNGDPVDLTGATIASELRKYPNSTILVNLNAAITSPTTGEWLLELSSTETTNIGFTYGSYDVEITFINGEVKKMLHGSITLKEEVTRA